MRYIGIDPGAYTAVVIMDGTAIRNVYALDLNKIKGSDKKILYYFTHLTEILKCSSVDKVYCEEPFMPPNRPQAGKSINKKLAIIELVCALNAVDLVFINPLTVKKQITGDGKADKVVVAQSLISKVSNPDLIRDLIDNKKFDETDSIAIALAGRMVK